MRGSWPSLRWPLSCRTTCSYGIRAPRRPGSWRERRPRRGPLGAPPRARRNDLRRGRARRPRAPLSRLRRADVAHLGQRPRGRRVRPVGCSSDRARLAPVRRLPYSYGPIAPLLLGGLFAALGVSLGVARGARRAARDRDRRRRPTASRASAWPCCRRRLPPRSSCRWRSRAAAARRSSTMSCPTPSLRRSRRSSRSDCSPRSPHTSPAGSAGCSRSPARALGLVAVTRPEAALAPAGAILVWLAVRAWAGRDARRSLREGLTIALPAVVVSVVGYVPFLIAVGPRELVWTEPVPGGPAPRGWQHRHLEHCAVHPAQRHRAGGLRRAVRGDRLRLRRGRTESRPSRPRMADRSRGGPARPRRARGAKRRRDERRAAPPDRPGLSAHPADRGRGSRLHGAPGAPALARRGRARVSWTCCWRSSCSPRRSAPTRCSLPGSDAIYTFPLAAILLVRLHVALPRSTRTRLGGCCLDRPGCIDRRRARRPGRTPRLLHRAGARTAPSARPRRRASRSARPCASSSATPGRETRCSSRPQLQALEVLSGRRSALPQLSLLPGALRGPGGRASGDRTARGCRRARRGARPALVDRVRERRVRQHVRPGPPRLGHHATSHTSQR